MADKSKKDYYELPEESEDGTTSVKKNTKWSTKKKILVWGGLALIVVIAIVLILVFTLKKSDSGSSPPIPDVFTEDPFYVQQVEGQVSYNTTFLITNRITHPDKADVNYELGPGLPSDTPVNRMADTIQGTVLLADTKSFKVSFVNDRQTMAPKNANQDIPVANAGIPSEIVDTQTTYEDIKPSVSLENAGFQFSANPFGWHIDRPNTTLTIFDTRGHALLMYDKFNEITWTFASNKTYGLGQRIGSLGLSDNTTYPMWNNPQTQTEGAYLYGTHPFYLNMANETTWVGVYIANAYAQSGFIKGNTVTHRTVGGNLEVFVWYGNTAQEVLKQYHSRVGKPFLPPLWALGFHYSRTGLNKIDNLTDIETNSIMNNLPLDGLWSDFDYMNMTRDFTVNDDFKMMNDTVTQWKAKGLHWVPKLYPFLPNNVTAEEGYLYYEKLINATGAIMGNETGMPLVGLNGMSENVYFDYWSKGGADVWMEGLNEFYSTVSAFDGLWLDKNEPQDDNMTNPETLYTEIPYTPGDRRLSNSTIPVNSMHTVAGWNNATYRDYDLHNMYGTKMAQLTSDWMDTELFKNDNRRGFLVSRSTFAGSGKFTGHSLGENESTFQAMRQSVASMLRMNMFGVAYSGAYVCGYMMNATDELCARWTQLAAFYPYFHNHNEANTVDQYPWSFDTNMTLQAAKGAAIQRYSWMQTLYQLYLDAHSEGGAIATPTGFNFPNDTTFDHESSPLTFMWSDMLLIAPNLFSGSSSFDTYIPPGAIWYNTTDRLFPAIESTGNNTLFSASNYTNVFLRGGSIVTYQNLTGEVFGVTLNNTAGLVQKPTEIIIAPDASGEATLSFSLDDGMSVGLTSLKEVDLSYQSKTLHIDTTTGLSDDKADYLPWQTASQLNFLGVATTLNDTFSICARYSNMSFALLQGKKDGPNVVVKTSDGSPLYYMMLRFVTIVDVTDPNPCMTEVQAEAPVKVGTNAQVMNLTVASPSLQGVQSGATNPSKLTLVAELLNTTRMDSMNRVIKINVTDAEKTRFAVPLATSDSLLTPSSEDIDTHLTLSQTPYFFKVLNENDPSDVELSSENQLFVYEDRFIEIDMLIASTGQYWGLGDRAPEQFFLNHGIYTSWARDIPTPVESGVPPGNNMYGTHPVLYTRLMNGKWMAIFVNNANAQDWILEPSGNPQMPLLSRYITIGGMLDMYVITGRNIEEVIQSYHELIGRPVLPPLYAFGFNQCRYGYRSQDELASQYQQAKDKNFPIDGLWTDIDYMASYTDFTVDTDRYPSLKDFIQSVLNADGVQFIPILDAGISANLTNNPIYADGLDKGAYFMSGFTNAPLVGEVWPGKAVYVNHLPGSAGAQWWKDQLNTFYNNEVPFGGLWLDMNEASNFCNGECPLGQSFELKNPTERYNLLYTPGMRSLETKSMSLNGYGEDGSGTRYEQYDIHSLYGYFEMKSTSEMMTTTLQKRPYIISRSTYAGAGRWGSHWLGDNFSTWEMMRYSVTQMMNFNMYGITLVGADVCGFIGDTTPTLCTRWMQLGAFSPFMRNHNNKGSMSQEPWSFSQPYYRIMQDATYLRYSLLRYIYSSYFNVHMNGGTLFRPRFFMWQDDPALYQNPGRDFVLGKALMVTPILEEDTTQVTIHFPKAGAWVNHADGTVLNLMTAQDINFAVSLETMFVHQIPGSIIPFQGVGGMTRNITQSSKLSTVRTALRVALDLAGMAQGNVILDDGMSLIDSNYWDIGFSFANGNLTFTVQAGAQYQYMGNDGNLGQIYVYGIGAAPSTVMMYFNSQRDAIELQSTYIADDQTVVVDWDMAANSVSLAEVKVIVFA